MLKISLPTPAIGSLVRVECKVSSSKSVPAFGIATDSADGMTLVAFPNGTTLRVNDSLVTTADPFEVVANWQRIRG